MEEKKSKNPDYAAACLLISAVIGILFSAMLLTGFMDVEQALEQFQDTEEWEVDLSYIIYLVNICMGVVLFLGIFQVTGAFMAYKRRYWVMCLIASIAGILMIGILFLSSIFSIASLVFLYKSKDEFS